MACSWDLLDPSTVRQRALVSVRVAVTVAVNQVLRWQSAWFQSVKVQVSDAPS